MNVVIVDGDVSYPATSGKRLRTLHLMLQLAGRHRVTYIARGQGDAAVNREATEFLRGHDIDAQIIDDPLPRKDGVGFYLRLAGNLLSPLPYSVATHTSQRMGEAVARHAARHKVDLYQLEWFAYRNAIPANGTPTVVQAPNIESLIWQRYYEAEKQPLRRWYILQQWRKFLRCERAAFHAARHVVTVSPEDAALAREWFGVENIDVVDNGVDFSYFRDVRQDAASRSILYLGALDWRPNLDALNLLLDAIFPSVRALLPDVRLMVVGRAPSDSLRRKVATEPGVELHADVPDVRPYLGQSAVLAVPLRIGGGSRLKILEALASGLPVVSTKVGAEGLCIRPEQDYTLADSPEEMTRALVRCLNHPQQAREQAERGRETVASRYDWASLAERLERVWEKAVSGRSRSMSTAGQG